MSKIIGRYHNLNGNTVLLQKRCLNLLTFLFYAVFIWPFKLLFSIISLGGYSPRPTPDWIYFPKDVTNESNLIFKIRERKNQLADEYERLDEQELSEIARIKAIKEEIEASKSSTKGYGEWHTVDLSQYRYISLSLVDPEHRWKRVLKSKRKRGAGGKFETDDNPHIGTTLAVIPGEFEAFSRSMHGVVKSDGTVDDVMFDKSNKEKSKSSSSSEKSSSSSDKPLHPGQLKGRKKISGESETSHSRRLDMLKAGEDIPDDWDIHQ